VVAPFTQGELLFGAPLTGVEIARRHRDGAEIIARRSGERLAEGAEPLFVVHADGRLDPVTATTAPEPQDGDRLVLLGAVPHRQTGPPAARASSPADEAATEP
jgi:hypothetical protein